VIDFFAFANDTHSQEIELSDLVAMQGHKKYFCFVYAKSKGVWAPGSISSRADPEEDHHRVIAAALRPPPDWRRPPGRPRSTWLRVIDEDVQPQNFGVHTTWRKAKDRDTWHQVVSTATLC